MKIANILSTTKIEAPEDFNIVKSSIDLIDGLPTLIVGYDYVNKHYHDFDITNIKLEPNLYWTFKKTEKRDKFDEDLRWFIRKVYEDLTDKLIYLFVDPIQHKPKTLRKIVKKILSLNDVITYQHNEMFYVYSDNLIFGIDLKLLKYLGFNTDKIKEKIKSISNVFLIDDEILIGYKKCIETLNNRVRYIPYLYFIRNGKNNTSSIIHIPRES
jgi:hypothetical protein